MVGRQRATVCMYTHAHIRRHSKRRRRKGSKTRCLLFIRRAYLVRGDDVAVLGVVLDLVVDHVEFALDQLDGGRPPAARIVLVLALGEHLAVLADLERRRSAVRAARRRQTRVRIGELRDTRANKHTHTRHVQASTKLIPMIRHAYLFGSNFTNTPSLSKSTRTALIEHDNDNEQQNWCELDSAIWYVYTMCSPCTKRLWHLTPRYRNLPWCVCVWLGLLRCSRFGWRLWWAFKVEQDFFFVFLNIYVIRISDIRFLRVLLLLLGCCSWQNV